MTYSIVVWSAAVVPHVVLDGVNTAAHGGSTISADASFSRFDTIASRPQTITLEDADIRVDDPLMLDCHDISEQISPQTNDWLSNFTGAASQAAPPATSLQVGSSIGTDGGGGGSWTSPGAPAGRSAG